MPRNHFNKNQSLVGGGRKVDTRGEQNRVLKMKEKYPCRKCDKYRHWKDAHKSDGSLKPDVVSIGNAYEKSSADSVKFDIDESSRDIYSQNPQATMGSTSFLSYSTLVANITHSAVVHFRWAGPLVDEGASYCAIGEMELHIVSVGLIHNRRIDDKPDFLQKFDS